MKDLIFNIFFILLVVHFFSCEKEKRNAKEQAIQDTVINLENSESILSIDLYGGAFIDFHLKANPVNPLNWRLSSSEMPENNKTGAPFQGHFLCLGRWGSPSEGEIKLGVPHNGEPSNTFWDLDSLSQFTVIMNNHAALDGLFIKRKVELDHNSSIIRVTEDVVNQLTIGRIYNIVQHPTLAPPFLDSTTIIDSNADHGFLQVFSYPDPHSLEFQWPFINLDTLNNPIDFRNSKSKENYVSTHIFENKDHWGWITAASPKIKLLIGYFWKTEDYPWLNVWHHVQENNPVAKGLEFGTTGIGRPYEELLAVNTRFHGHNSFEYIDAGETKQKIFFAFLMEIPVDFKGVSGIDVKGESLIVKERSGTDPREFNINTTLIN